MRKSHEPDADISSVINVLRCPGDPRQSRSRAILGNIWLKAADMPSPLFNTYRIQALGRPQKYWAIDRTALGRAGGSARKTHRPKDHVPWIELVIHPLPAMEDMTDQQRQTFFRKQVQDDEAFHAQTLRDEGRRFMTIDERDSLTQPCHMLLARRFYFGFIVKDIRASLQS
jgi:hypothetical protein